MQIIVFFLALFISAVSLGAFVSKLALLIKNYKNLNIFREMIFMVVACILWSVLYYLHLN